jgi:hypothetical protein
LQLIYPRRFAVIRNLIYPFAKNLFIMAIKTSIFGRVELSGQEAAQFLKHMHEDKPNPVAQATLARGRELLRQMQQTTTIRPVK